MPCTLVARAPGPAGARRAGRAAGRAARGPASRPDCVVRWLIKRLIGHFIRWQTTFGSSHSMSETRCYTPTHLRVGVLVGRRVGARVGALVGRRVGTRVGALVGGGFMVTVMVPEPTAVSAPQLVCEVNRGMGGKGVD